MKIRRELVEAGAGCGKTESLISRYIEALGFDAKDGRPLKNESQRLDPADIIALTFTEDAAAQMKERLLKRLDSLGHKALKESVQQSSQISTFHSLCFRLLMPHMKALGYRSFEKLAMPTVAKLLRKRSIMNFLSHDDERKTLLRHLNLHEISELGAELWFSSKNEQKKSIKDFLNDSRLAFEEFRLSRARELQDLFENDPEFRKCPENAWPRSFAEALSEPTYESAERMEFRAARKLGQMHPRLMQDAKNYRAFLHKFLYLSISDSALEHEEAIQEKILNFFARATQAGPKILDYNALEFELVRWIQEQKGTGLRKCRLLIVDEFQDTNRRQYEILKSLSEPNTEWYFVGDPKQSIYAFRGADVSLFLELRRELELKALDTNYRSDPPVLEFMNQVQGEIFALPSPLDPPAQRLKAGKILTATESTSSAGDAQPAVVIREYVGDQTFKIEDFIEDFRAREAAQSHAVLFTSWRGLYIFAERLEKKNIPFQISGSESFLSHPLTNIFAVFLDWIQNPENSLGAHVVARWLSGSEWNPQAVSHSDPALIRELFAQNADWTWPDALGEFCRVMRPGRWTKGEDWASAMERLIQELCDLELDAKLSLRELARFLELNRDRLDVKVPKVQLENSAIAARLTLMTIHGSKGLEFDSVYLPELYERARRGSQNLIEEEDGASLALRFEEDGQKRKSLYFLHRQHLEKLRLESEQRRLFYVALTRAKKSLNIYMDRASEPKVADQPYSILSWPEIRRSYWNRSLQVLATQGSFNELQADDAIAWKILEENEEAKELKVAPPEEWNLPRGLSFKS